ncbi:MAG: heme-copper oxidase subunit III [Thermoflexales bacterium]|nr:heme-copper oxidase subunit III [Thermoflexales bacterium]
MPFRARANTGLLGAAALIVAESMFFLGVLSAWYYLQVISLGNWPPAALRPRTFTLPLINTAIILVSTLALFWGERGIAAGNKRRLTIGVAVAAATGLLFMAMQTVEFSGLGFRATGSAYGSMFFALLVFHLLRVFVGVAWMAVVLIRSLMGQFDQKRRTVVQACAMYWYFITVIWLIVFAVLYLL